MFLNSEHEKEGVSFTSDPDMQAEECPSGDEAQEVEEEEEHQHERMEEEPVKGSLPPQVKNFDAAQPQPQQPTPMQNQPEVPQQQCIPAQSTQPTNVQPQQQMYHPSQQSFGGVDANLSAPMPHFAPPNVGFTGHPHPAPMHFTPEPSVDNSYFPMSSTSTPHPQSSSTMGFASGDYSSSFPPASTHYATTDGQHHNGSSAGYHQPQHHNHHHPTWNNGGM